MNDAYHVDNFSQISEPLSARLLEDVSALFADSVVCCKKIIFKTSIWIVLIVND